MGETILSKAIRKFPRILGVLLAVYAGLLAAYLLLGFIFAVMGRTHFPKKNVVGFLINGIAYAIVLWGFVRARQQKVLGGILIIVGALLAVPMAIVAGEPLTVPWLLSYIVVFLVAGALFVFYGLRD
jgi:peptidoglycan/LPS O-acetylase OafA/YrhL